MNHTHTPKVVILITLFLFLMVWPAQMGAQDQTGWHATYWNNVELTGDPVLQIFETDSGVTPALDRSWGTGRPWPQVETDFFSARWTRTVTLQPGRYRFTGTADDGMRVYVNGIKIIDEWQNTVVRAYAGWYDVPKEGPVTITVEYYEYQHEAIAKLFWDRVYGSDTIRDGQPYQPPIAANHWKGEYFNGREPGVMPEFVRSDPVIDFDWGLEAPIPEALRAEQFSVRWTRILNLPAGLYRFKTETDDGVRLFLNGQKTIDQWHTQTFAPHTTDWNHSGGPLKVVMEYYDELGLAAARLSWENIGEARPNVAPTRELWTSEYYNNSVLASKPVVVSMENAIDFKWDRGTFPHPHYVTREGYSIRFTGSPDLPSGRYRFAVTVDDGARLWVNNTLVLDKWRKHPEVTYTVDVEIPGGSTPIRLEYFNIETDARIKMTFERLDGPPVTARPASDSPADLLDVGTDPHPVIEIGIVAKVRVATARVRSAPSSLAPVATTLRRAQPVEMTGRNRFNSWLQVRLPDASLGWISVLDVDPAVDISELPIIKPNPQPTGGELPQGPHAVVVTSGLNQVRERPSMLSARITSLPRNSAYPALGRNRFGTWIKIELPEGKIGWIGTPYVTADYDLQLLTVVEDEAP